MRIENIQNELRGDSRRATADVIWEDSPRKPLSVYFETDSRFCGGLDRVGGVYLLAAAPAALFQGERRIRIESSLDSVLSDGVATALAILGNWYNLGREPLTIEPARGFVALEPAPDHAALFLTGGVDSLHSLLFNRRSYPTTHAASFRSAISIADLAFPGAESSPRSQAVTDRQHAAVREICRLEHLEMIAIRTNMRRIEPEYSFANRAALGSCLAAAAHLISKTVSSATISAGSHINLLSSRGSDPRLDANYSGGALEIRHEGSGYTRQEKVEAIARSATALENLFVCYEGPLGAGERNCGKCEKCVRTMTSLFCAGRLKEARSFPTDEVSAEMIAGVDLGHHPEYFSADWAPIRDALASAGRRDLARAVKRRLAAAERYPDWLAGKGFRELLRRWDRRFFRGLLVSTFRRLRAPSSHAVDR